MKRMTAAVAAMVCIAGCSSPQIAHDAERDSTSPPSTATEQPAARGVEASIERVPWSKVGPGWLLATWAPATGAAPGEEKPPGEPPLEDATRTLYLVDPAGGRYPITTFPPPGEKPGPELVDWSGDGSRALFYSEYSSPPTAITVDLRTGKQTPVPVSGAPRFTRPAGKALLLSTSPGPGSRAATLTRVDLTGKPQLTFPTDTLESAFNGRYLAAPDGTRLILGTAAGLVVMGNDGHAGKMLSIPDQTDCSPVRWWDDGKTALAQCTANDGSYMTRLWTVPVDGSRPAPLTAPTNGQSGRDLGDVNAWRLSRGTFVQALGACGLVYLAKLNGDGTTAPVSVPGAESGKSVEVVGVDGDSLDLQAHAACGGGQSLLRFDPASNTSTVLLGPPVNGGGVIDVVPYPGQR